MAGMQSGDFDSPDETRTPEKTRVDELLGDERFVGFDPSRGPAEEYAPTGLTPAVGPTGY